MANRTWTGAVSGAWGTAGNWAEAAVPIDGDDVFIQGSVSITGSDQSATELASLRVSPHYTGDIGSSGTYLQIDAVTFDYAGHGSAYINGIFTTLRVTGAVGDTALNMLGSVVTARITGEAVNGLITFGNSMVLDLLEVQSAGGTRIDLGTGILTAAAGAPSLTMDSGQVECSSALATVEMVGGSLTHDTGAIATLQLESLATCIYKSSGTITTLTVYGGLFDGTQNTNPSTTITNASIHENGEIDVQSGLRNFTFTNGIIYHGGAVKPDHGQTITFA